MKVLLYQSISFQGQYISVLIKTVCFCSYIILCSMILDANLLYSAELHAGSGRMYSTIASAILGSSNGDTIYIHEGTYYENNLIPKSGTTLSGVDGENLPIINAQQTAFSHDWNDNPISIENNDITLYRLDIRDGATGSVIIEDFGADNIEISYCRFIRTAMPTTSDNAALVYVKPGTTNIYVHHNYFESATGGFHGAIYFRPNGGTSPFYNNEIRINAKAYGYFIKHAGNSTNRLQIHNNFIVMNYTSHYDTVAIFVSHDNVDIYNNLIIGNGGIGVKIALDAGGCGGSGTVLNHNTIYMGTAIRGTFKIDNDCDVTNITFKNNILHRTSTSTEFLNVNAWIYGTTRTWTGHHNLVFQNNQGSALFASPSRTYTLADWKATDQGSGSYAERPIFANNSGNLNAIYDFEVIDGNAKNGADDGADMGADISLVGIGVVDNIPQPVSSPSAPEEFINN